jgi:hypothetical protein
LKRRSLVKKLGRAADKRGSNCKFSGVVVEKEKADSARR